MSRWCARAIRPRSTSRAASMARASCSARACCAATPRPARSTLESSCRCRPAAQAVRQPQACRSSPRRCCEVAGGRRHRHASFFGLTPQCCGRTSCHAGRSGVPVRTPGKPCCRVKPYTVCARGARGHADPTPCVKNSIVVRGCVVLFSSILILLSNHNTPIHVCGLRTPRPLHAAIPPGERGPKSKVSDRGYGIFPLAQTAVWRVRSRAGAARAYYHLGRARLLAI